MTKPRPEWDVILETDAAVRHGNPGTATFGFVAISPFDNSVIYEDCGLLPGLMDSNEAEYWAVVKALQFAKDLGYPEVVELRSDSLTMIRQLTGQYNFRSDKLNRVATKVWELMRWFYRVDLIFIPRRWNGHADALSKAGFAHNKNTVMRGIVRSSYETMPSGHRLLDRDGYYD